MPVATMPSWLQGFAQNQPVTQVVNAVRYLAVGGVPNGQHYIYATILWSLGIIAVFAPLAIRMYRKIQ